MAPAEPKTVGERLIEGQVDEAAMFEASTFPIKPPQLIERAKVARARVHTPPLRPYANAPTHAERLISLARA